VFSIHRLRYRYRKLLLAFIPARAYFIETNIPPHEIDSKVNEMINQDRLYFLFPSRSQKPYTGRLGVNSFIAIRNSRHGWQRQIKLKANFFSRGEKVYLRLIMSNPFSIVNLSVLGVLYTLFLLFAVWPFESLTANIAVWAMPVILTYMITNFSFQAIYKREKLLWFKLFKGRRLTEMEVKKLGLKM
jgi:hypothetical protein